MGRLAVVTAWQPHPAEEEVIARAWPHDVARYALPSDGELPPGVEGAVSAIVGMPRQLGLAVVERLPALRLLHLTGHGVDALREPRMHALIQERSITVATASSGAPGIAEFAIMCLIALSRRLVPIVADFTERGSWSGARKRRRMEGDLGGEVAGTRLLIVGYGPLGREIAGRARSLGMHVTVVRRRAAEPGPDDPIDAMHPVAELDDLLAAADHVVLCLPLTEATRRLFDAERLARLRPGSFLVNVARGPVVDEHAVLDLLRSGHLGGAAIDVWSSEEGETGVTPDPGWSSLNLLATPHYAGLTREARLRTLEVVGDNLHRLGSGRPLRNVVDLRAGYAVGDE